METQLTIKFTLLYENMYTYVKTLYEYRQQDATSETAVSLRNMVTSVIWLILQQSFLVWMMFYNAIVSYSEAISYCLKEVLGKGELSSV